MDTGMALEVLMWVRDINYINGQGNAFVQPENIKLKEDYAGLFDIGW